MSVNENHSNGGRKAGDWDELLAETAEKLHQIALMQLLAKNATDENDHLGF